MCQVLWACEGEKTHILASRSLQFSKEGMISILIIVPGWSEKCHKSHGWMNAGIPREKWLGRKNILTSDQGYIGLEPLKLGGNFRHKE